MLQSTLRGSWASRSGWADDTVDFGTGATANLHHPISMMQISTSLHRVTLALTAAGALASCGGDAPTGTTPSIAGAYTATELRVTPNGQSTIDVLAQGGTLAIAIAPDNTTSGTLVLPATVTGGAGVTESMAGTVVRTGNTVRFQQSADTFVRDLTWTASGNTLQVKNQTVGSANYTVTMSRQ